MAKTVQKPKAKKSVGLEVSTKKQSSVKNIQSSIMSYRPSKKVAIALVIAGLLILLTVKKNIFLAAMVDNSPITNPELLSRLNKEYRTQVLNQMINEKIILTEAKKNGVVVSSNDINKRITEIESNVGGAQSLDSLLTQQGQTRDSLKDQLLLQLTVEKLYAKDATVSAEEIQKFIAQNKDQLQATDSAGQEKEVAETLKQQKLSDTFKTKFQELKQKAKVQIF